MACRPDSSALAPRSLSSTRDLSALRLHWAPSILRLHFGQTSPRLCHVLVGCPLRSVSPPLPLCLVPPSLRLHLSRSNSSSALWYPGSSSDGRRYGSVVATRISGVGRSHLLSVCAKGSTNIGSIARPYDVGEGFSNMAPSSLDVTMGFLPSWMFLHRLSCSWQFCIALVGYIPLQLHIFHQSPLPSFLLSWTLFMVCRLGLMAYFNCVLVLKKRP